MALFSGALPSMQQPQRIEATVEQGQGVIRGAGDELGSQPHLAHQNFNASMTALNLLKLEDRQYQAGLTQMISITHWKIRKINAHLLEHFSSYLGLDFNCIKSRPDFEEMCNDGAIAS